MLNNNKYHEGEIMSKSFYEDRLKKSEAEEMWDLRAESFNKSQQKVQSEIEKGILKFLKDKDILGDADILDVCGGSGRYGIPLAKMSKSVTMTDISGNMLKFAKENAEREGLDNMDFVHIDWSNADFNELNWNRRFDLSFATMCPGVGSKDGLKRFIESSKKYCMVNQYIDNNDNIGDHIRERLGKLGGYDPHKDREAVEELFNTLWREGYSPEINYVTQSNAEEVTVDEAYTIYAGRYKKSAEDKNLNLREIIEEKSKDGIVEIEKDTTLAMVFWKVK